MCVYIISDDGFFLLGVTELYKKKCKPIISIHCNISAITAMSSQFNSDDVVLFSINNDLLAIPILMELKRSPANIVQIVEHINGRVFYIGNFFLSKKCSTAEICKIVSFRNVRKHNISPNMLKYMDCLMKGEAVSDIADRFNVNSKAVYSSIHNTMKRFGIQPQGAKSLLLLHRLMVSKVSLPHL